jgi:hypothetical protein
MCVTPQTNNQRNLGINQTPVDTFDPEGSDYDYKTARAGGLGPTGDGTKENAGHWGSVTMTTAAERKKHNLPDESYVVLKGKSHATFNKAVAGEEERGFQIVKRGSRYYSVPKD